LEAGPHRGHIGKRVGTRPRPEAGSGALHDLSITLERGEADAIVAEAAAAYFAGCRARVRPFVDRNFSLRGTIGLHRHALGLDLVRAPANAVLAVPQVGLKLAATGARRLGAVGAAARLQRQNVLLETAVMREIRWRIVTELLRQPMRDGARKSREDALAETILSHPRVASLVGEAAATAGARSDDPGFRARLESTLAEYTGTRAAASDIATALIALGTGAVTFHKATPGAIALGPLVAASLAQHAAVASFPLGVTAGGLWYGMFPVQASPLLVAGSTAGLMGAAAILAAFAGVVSDPLQRHLGLHERRLRAMIDGLEQGFAAENAAGFVAYDLYVARLMDLSDALIGVVRAFRG
jgi:hypothetical protein